MSTKIYKLFVVSVIFVVDPPKTLNIYITTIGDYTMNYDEDTTLDAMCDDIHKTGTITTRREHSMLSEATFDFSQPDADKKKKDEDEDEGDDTQEPKTQSDSEDDEMPFEASSDDSSTEGETDDSDDSDADAGTTQPENHMGSSTGSGNYTEATDYGIKLLMFAQKVHMWHLNCKQANHHDVLKGFYASLEDSADAILESIIEKTQSEVSPNMGEYDFGNVSFDPSSAISEIEAIRDESSKFTTSQSENAGLSNIFADLTETIDSVLYKLKRLEV